MISDFPHTLRRRWDDEDDLYQCVTVDNINFTKFSYHKLIGDKEVETKQFDDMQEAIRYFNDKVDEYMKPWSDKVLDQRKGMTKKITGQN